MEQIKQLKSMRDAAQDRLQANPDFKLKNSLDSLIDDLEAFMSGDGGSVVENAVDVETQDELVASDDEEEQQPEYPAIDEVASGDQVHADNEHIDEVVENEDISVELDEEAEIAAAIAENISAEDIAVEGDVNGSGYVDTTQLDMEAEAAIEALEAELSQSDPDIKQSTSNSR
jgi:hypothetical protein